MRRVAQLSKNTRETAKPAGSPEFQGLLHIIEENAAKLDHKASAHAPMALIWLSHSQLFAMHCLLCGLNRSNITSAASSVRQIVLLACGA